MSKENNCQILLWSAMDSGLATPDITHPVRLVVLRERVSVRKSMAAVAEWVGASSGDLLDDIIILLQSWWCVLEDVVLIEFVWIKAIELSKFRGAIITEIVMIERKEAALMWPWTNIHRRVSTSKWLVAGADGSWKWVSEVRGERSDVKNFALFRDRGHHPFYLQVYSLVNSRVDRHIEGEMPPFARLLSHSHTPFSNNICFLFQLRIPKLCYLLSPLTTIHIYSLGRVSLLSLGTCYSLPPAAPTN